MINTTVEGRATYGEALTIAGSGHCGMTIRSGTTHYGILHFSDGTSGADEYSGMVEYLQGTNRMRLFAGGKYNIVLNGGGSTEINHNENKRLEALDHGVEITGRIRANSTTDSYPIRSYNSSTSASAKTGINLQLERNASAVQFDAVRLIAGKRQEWTGVPSTVDSYFATEIINDESMVEKVRVDNDGLKFNGDTAAANALSDYEEGSFNPAVSGASSAGTGSNSAIEGHYTKIGNLVHVDIYINQTSHNGTGQVRISTPFSCKSGAQVVGSVMLDHVDFDSNFRTIASHIWGGSSLIALYGTRDDASWDGIGMSGNLDSSVRYILSITYPVA
tara:strand:+ start:1 stop:999 length:999 start_codon:yes stop_codon:yes gene_type:complete